jgi:23S rRNA (adenine2030-N6)-methyltransferase
MALLSAPGRVMLSYRHAFHAGNHADVLKHLVVAQLLLHLTKKDKPLWVVDTHAGAGRYSLETGYAAKNAEYESGIGRLWSRTDLPPPLANYVAQVRAINPDGTLRWYPGSPQLALQMTRPHDRLRLFELHPTDSAALAEYFRGAGRRVAVVAGDGYAGLKSVLPPSSRRALVLIDPSYELATDYRAVARAMRDALLRFPTGTYAVWYPQLQRRDSETLPESLRRVATGDWLHVSLTVKAPQADGYGLHGSGMFVFNPTWGLEAVLRGVMPRLVKLLGQDDGAGFELQFRQT